MVIGPQGEMPAVLVVEDGREDRRRIEMRRTKPIDGAIHTDQRGGVKISDDAVIFDTQIHSSSSNPFRVNGTLDEGYRRAAEVARGFEIRL